MAKRTDKDLAPRTGMADGGQDRPPVDYAAVDAHLPALPAADDEWISVMARDPSTLHCQWHVSEPYRRAVKDAGGKDFCLRLYDVSEAHPHQAAAPATEVSFSEDQARWTLPVPRGGRPYTAEIGYRGIDQWLPLARSPVCAPPPGRPTAASRRQPARVEQPVYATFRPEPTPTLPNPAVVPLRAPAPRLPSTVWPEPQLPPSTWGDQGTPPVWAQPRGAQPDGPQGLAQQDASLPPAASEREHAAALALPDAPAVWRPAYRGTPSILPFASACCLPPRPAHLPAAHTAMTDAHAPSPLGATWRTPETTLDWETYAAYLYRYVMGRDAAMIWTATEGTPLLGDSAEVSRYLSACAQHYFGERTPNYALIDRLLAEAQAEMVAYVMNLGVDQRSGLCFAGASEHVLRDAEAARPAAERAAADALPPAFATTSAS